MKKTFKFTFAAAALLISGMGVQADGNQQTADEAKARLDDLAEVFKNKGVGAFAFMNGHDMGGTAGSRRTTGTSESDKYGEVLKSDDGRSPIICVADGKYVVNQLQPMLVGKDTMIGEAVWRDGVGVAMTERVIKALRESNNGVATVKYVEATKGVNEARQARPEEQKLKLLAYSSEKLLGKKNDSGQKFFCATPYENLDSSDEGDYDRLTAADEPKGGKAKKHNAKKHAEKKA